MKGNSLNLRTYPRRSARARSGRTSDLRAQRPKARRPGPSPRETTPSRLPWRRGSSTTHRDRRVPADPCEWEKRIGLAIGRGTGKM